MTYCNQDLRVKSEECVQLCAEKNELKLQLEVGQLNRAISIFRSSYN